MQEEHQQAIAGRKNQIQALEFTSEEHEQKILRLNKEIDYLIKNRYVTRRGCFDNVLPFIKKNSGKGHPNPIHRWNIFKREVIKKPNYSRNHFSLTKENRELYETALDVII